MKEAPERVPNRKAQLPHGFPWTGFLWKDW